MTDDPQQHLVILLEDIRDLLIWQHRDDLPRQYRERLAELVAEHKALKEKK